MSVPAACGGTADSMQRSDNQTMNIFYWTITVVIVGTFIPSVLYFVLYAVTSKTACLPACLNRTRAFWVFTRIFSLLGVNILICGHVVVGLWRIWFR